MKKPSSLIILITALCLAALTMSTLALVGETGAHKIGYVQSHKLIFGYTGMKEAAAEFSGKRERWQSEVDTIKADFRHAVAAYDKERPTLSLDEREARLRDLQSREEDMRRTAMGMEERMKEMEEKMTGAVLNQVNEVVRQYGRDHGFDLILGTTESGSVLYGDEAIDVTEDLLRVLNEAYGAHPNEKE